MLTTVIAGHVCLDIIPAIPNAIDLLPGRLYEVGPATIGTGGPVSNTGMAMHILGLPTMLMGKIGDDNFGDAILSIFKHYDPRLAEGMIRVPGETTSYSVVVNIPGRDRTFLHCCGANHTFAAADVPYARIAGAGLFHFGYPTLMGKTYERDGAELEAIFRQVKASGPTTSLDLAMPDPGGPSGRAPWATILQRTLPYVDVFLPSADELLYMIDREHYGRGDNLSGDELSAIGARLLGMGVAIAGVKLGSRGLYVRTAPAARLAKMGRLQVNDLAAWADRELWFPVFQVEKVVSAVGAGDATIAGFLAALQHGLGLVDAGRSANMVGAMNVTTADALSGLRHWDLTQQTLAARPIVRLPPPGPGWTEMKTTGIWEKR